MKQFLSIKQAIPSRIALTNFFTKYIFHHQKIPALFLLIAGFFLINTAEATTRTSTATGGAWATAGTWVGGVAPVAADTVIIATTGASVVTVGAAATCGKLTINSGATLTLTTFGLTVNGVWINNGTLNAGTSTITFGGANAAINTGTGTGNFNIITPAAAGVTLAINTNTTCAALTFVASTVAATVNIASGVTLTVTGAVTIPRPTTVTNTLAVGSGTLSAGSIAFTNGGGGVRHLITISTGTVSVSGNVTQVSSTGSASITFTGAGSLNLGGSFLTSTTGTLTLFAGCTINYNGAVQTVGNFTYNNLTLSGSAAKTMTGVTVNGILSMEGTATASVAPTYGAAATLEYNGTTRTTGLEWITPFVATGGIIIANAGVVTLGASKVLNATIPLTFSGSNAILDIAGFNLTDTAGITGTSATSYVKSSGAGILLTNIGNGASVTFPVGNSSYDPVTITNNTGSADNFSVRVLDEVYVNGSTAPAISSPRVIRTWDITKAGANAGSGVDFVFNWNPGETSGSITTPKLFHYRGSYWDKLVLGITTPGTNTLTYTGYQSSSFSPFAIVDDAFTLPISWLSFTAQKQSKTIFLNWSTASELNCKNFLVEHSTNGVNWQSIGTVNAANNSVSAQLYQYDDANPSQGINYYRLQQIDFNGNSSYSKIVSVIYSDSKSQIIIYPNPVVNGVINIQLDQATTVKIFNSTGVLVMSKLLQAGIQQIDVSNLAKGIYQAQAGTQTLKVVIQ